MANKIKLTYDEVEQILDNMKKFNCKICDVEVNNSSGIGAITTATFPIIHEGVGGLLTVEITGVDKW